MSSDRSVSPWIHSVAALTAAVVSTTLTHPLDLIKARLQTQHVMQSVAREVGDSKSTRIAPPRYRSTIQAARLIVREESWRGLYRGLGPNVLGNGLAWGAYMFLYPTFKTWLAGRDGAVNSVESFVLAGLAGAGTQVVTNPIWLVKLRLQSQPHDSDRRYRGMIDAVRTIVREEGILGFWRGLTPALVGTIHGAVQMVIYEAMRAATIRRVEGKDDGGQMGPQHYLLLGMASKSVATFVTFPYQLVKARMQVRDLHFHRHPTMRTTVVAVWRNEGFRGFYRGVFPASVRAAPHSAIFFYAYEYMRSALSDTRL